MSSTARDDAAFQRVTGWINDLHENLSLWGISVVGLCRESGCGLPVILDDSGMADEGGMFVYGTCPSGHELSGPRGLLLIAIKEMFD